MRISSNEHIFPHAWSAVSAANWIKYPNEITTHVIHVDYLSRHLDKDTGILHTERLLTLKQSLPDFILKFMGTSHEAYVYEKSEVDPNQQRLVLRTRNLTLSEMMTIDEECVYTPDPIKPFTNTLFKQNAQISSMNGFTYIRNKIEAFCVDRFDANAAKGRAALETVLQTVTTETKEAFHTVEQLTQEAYEKLKEDTIEVVDLLVDEIHTVERQILAHTQTSTDHFMSKKLVKKEPLSELEKDPPSSSSSSHSQPPPPPPPLEI